MFTDDGESRWNRHFLRDGVPPAAEGELEERDDAFPACMRPVLTSIGSLPRQAPSLEDAIVKAVELQREHGLTRLTDGEPRGDMLSLYASLPGIRSIGSMPRIVGRVRSPEDPAEFPKIRDLDFVRSRFPDLAFKVSLTGPTTFILAAASTGAGPAYKGAMDPALHDDLTEAIRPIAREAARRGADVQIDDPILSQGMRDFGPAMRRLDAIASEVPRDRASLHVCGSLARGKVLDALFRLENASTFNLAFAGRAERGNLDLLSRREWEDRDCSLGAGVANVQASTKEEVTRSDEVARLLRLASERVGEGRLRAVTPDCGLRATAAELVHPILSELHGGYRIAFQDA